MLNPTLNTAQWKYEAIFKANRDFYSWSSACSGNDTIFQFLPILERSSVGVIGQCYPTLKDQNKRKLFITRTTMMFYDVFLNFYLALRNTMVWRVLENSRMPQSREQYVLATDGYSTIGIQNHNYNVRFFTDKCDIEVDKLLVKSAHKHTYTHRHFNEAQETNLLVSPRRPVSSFVRWGRI